MLRYIGSIILWLLMFFRFILFLIVMVVGGAFYHIGNFLINSGKKLMKYTAGPFE